MFLKNVGYNANRLSSINPLEMIFARKWDENNGNDERWDRELLPYLLDPFNQYNPQEPSERDYKVAATVIQWLGSGIGQSFIQSTLINQA